jgi:hypothetical protein
MILINVIVLAAGLFSKRWENLFGIAIDVATLLSTNKCCYLTVALCNGCGACLMLMSFVGVCCALFMPDAEQRGILKDISANLAAQGLKDTDDTSGHAAALFVLFSTFVGFITCAAAAYYAFQVYHYPGDVEELKHGPGLDGQGHVVGQNCDEESLSEASSSD